MDSSFFRLVTIKALEVGIRPNLLVILQALCLECGDKDRCKVSIRKLASITNLNKNTVNKGIHELAAFGIVIARIGTKSAGRYGIVDPAKWSI